MKDIIDCCTEWIHDTSTDSSFLYSVIIEWSCVLCLLFPSSIHYLFIFLHFFTVTISICMITVGLILSSSSSSSFEGSNEREGKFFIVRASGESRAVSKISWSTRRRRTTSAESLFEHLLNKTKGIKTDVHLYLYQKVT